MTNHATRDRAMHTYAVGDVQGCLDSFERLLGQLPEPQRLIFVGDIVNRGPQSLGMLRAVTLARRLPDVRSRYSAITTYTCSPPMPACGRCTTRTRCRRSSRRPIDASLIDWLRTLPLAHFEDGRLFVHAGVPPQWIDRRDA